MYLIYLQHVTYLYYYGGNTEEMAGKLINITAANIISASDIYQTTASMYCTIKNNLTTAIFHLILII